MNVFELAAVLKLNKDQYDKGLGEAERTAETKGQKIANAVSGMAKAGTVAVAAVGTAVVGSTKKLVDGVSAVAEYGDAIDKNSQKLGLSTDAYQEWDFILQHSGLDMSAMTGVMKSMIKNTEKNTDAFEELGITQEELQNSSPEEIFKKTITALQGVTDENKRNSLATQTLGARYAQLNPLLNTSVEETEAMRKKVHALGGVMAEDAVKSAARFQDSLQDAQYAVTGLKNNLLSQLLPSFADVIDGFTDVVSGVDGGSEKLAEGIKTAIKDIQALVPQFIEIAKTIVFSLSEGLVAELPTIIQTLTDLFLDIIEEITVLLPDIVNTIVTVVPSIIKSLAEALPSLIEAIAGAIPEIIAGLAEALPAVIEAIVGVIPDLIDALLKTIPNIILALCEAIPQIITSIIELLPQLFIDLGTAIIENFPAIVAAVAEGLVTVAAEIVGWFGHLFTTVDENIAALSEDIREKSESFTTFAEVLESTEPQIADWNTLVSSSGHTLEELQSSIDTCETAITDIIKTQLQTQQGLRDEDIKKIEEYRNEINRLEQEKLEIYVSQQVAQLTKLKNESDTIDKESAAQHLSNIESAHKEASEANETAYTTQLQSIENQYTAMGKLDSEEYKRAVKDAKTAYETRKTTIEKSYDDSLQTLTTKTNQWKDIDAKHWATLNKQLEGFNTSSKSSFDKFIFNTNDTMGNFDDAKEKYAKILDTMVDSTSKDWLQMQLTMKSKGQDISKDSQKTASDILGVFEGKTKGFDDIGKNYLLGMIDGMEDKIPGLKNASSMSADEIVKVLKRELDIHSPSRVTSNIGGLTIEGLIDGMKNKGNQLNNYLSGLGRTLSNSMDDIGRNMAQGVASGFLSQEWYIYNTVSAMMDRITDSVRSQMQIASPSKVFAYFGEMMSLGLAKGIDDEAAQAVKATEAMSAEITDAFTLPDTNFGSISIKTADSSNNNNQKPTTNNITLNVYGSDNQDVEDLADIVIRKLQTTINQEVMAYA